MKNYLIMYTVITTIPIFLLGFVSSTVQFEEGFVFPCASMSVGTILMFANDERLMFSTSTSETVYPSKKKMIL